MGARTDKGSMGRWGSDDGKESGEALSHVHERCEGGALAKSKNWRRRTDRGKDTAFPPPAVEELNRRKENQARRST